MDEQHINPKKGINQDKHASSICTINAVNTEDRSDYLENIVSSAENDAASGQDFIEKFSVVSKNDLFGLFEDAIKRVVENQRNENETLKRYFEGKFNEIQMELMSEMKIYRSKLEVLENLMNTKRTIEKQERKIKDSSDATDTYKGATEGSKSRHSQDRIINREKAQEQSVGYLNSKRDEISVKKDEYNELDRQSGNSRRALYTANDKLNNKSDRTEKMMVRPSVEIIPKVKNYQLIGDSQFARYAQKILGLPYSTNRYGAKYIGYCTSGDTLLYLRKRIESNEYRIHDKLILMIGTNNLKKDHDPKQMIDDLRRLLDVLLTDKAAGKIILLTVPPILLKEKQLQHWTALQEYNRAIMDYHNGRDIIAVNFTKYFIDYREDKINDKKDSNENDNNSYEDNIDDDINYVTATGSIRCNVKSKYYEPRIRDGVDKVHLNYEGFLILKKLFAEIIP